MNALLFLFLLFGLCYSDHPAQPCRSLHGFWYNQLGSEVLFNHSQADGSLIGEYRTAVERTSGSAGSSFSIVQGVTSPGSTKGVFGFSVNWQNGASTTAWTGQCFVCNGKEVLITSWLLRSKQSSCLSKWAAVRVGQDIFTREEQTIGPRKRFDTHTPSRFVNDPASINNELARKKRSTVEDNRTRRRCSLVGDWYNNVGSQMKLSHGPDNVLRGVYKTASERREKVSDDDLTHTRVFGLGNPNDENTTFSMFIIWNKGRSITGWTGQCHDCGGELGDNKTEILETIWLRRTTVPSCAHNWQSTLYGENGFIRDQIVNHEAIPGEDGEYDPRIGQCASSSSQPWQTAKNTLLVVITTFILGITFYLPKNDIT